MATSTIPAVKASILTRLQADADLADCQISWGNPYPNRMEKDLVLIGNAVATPGQEPAGLGTTGREESYNLSIIVSVVRPKRESQQTLETRAFVIAGVIEDSIIDWRSEASVFGGINGWMIFRGFTTGEGISEDGLEREATVTMTLEVVARI